MDIDVVSLLLQEIVEYDWLVKNDKRQNFFMESLEEPNTIVRQWKLKYASHFWEVLLRKVLTLLFFFLSVCTEVFLRGFCLKPRL